MTAVRPTTPARPRTSPHPPHRSALLAAARLGATTATADLSGTPAPGTRASWRRLRRRTTTEGRALLRVAFDTGYGQAMQTSGLLPR